MTRARDLSKFANSQAFSVDSDFQVGINSTVPAATLDVRGDSVITGILTATSIDATGLTGTPDITVNNIVGAAATFSGVITYEDVTNVDSVGVITARSGVRILVGESLLLQNAAGNAEGSIECDGAGTNTDIRIRTNSTERLRVTHAGLVGIGTDNPSSPLTVKEVSNVAIELLKTTNASVLTLGEDGSSGGNINAPNGALLLSQGGTERLRIDTGGRLGIGTDSPSSYSSSTNNLVISETGGNSGITLHTGSSYASYLGFTDTGDTNNQGYIGYKHSDNALVFSANSAERLRIDSNGNIGVNQTSVNSSRKMEITQPASYTSGLRINSAGASGNGAYFEVFVGSANYKFGGDHSTNALLFKKDGTEYMRHDSGGRLLIGHTSAAESNNMLEVSADHGGRIGFLRSDTSVSAGNNIGMLSFYGNDSNGTYQESARIQADADLDHATGDKPGRLSFLTSPDGSNTVAERLRIDSRGSFQFSNGFMNETVKINTTARTGTQAVNLDDGMVHYFSTNSSGTWKPNFTMSAGNDINATIATGDVFSPTMIVAKGATTHFANAIQIDGSNVTPEFLGGAPTDGGGSGTFDVYNYTIIKTGDDTFKAFASVSTYE